MKLLLALSFTFLNCMAYAQSAKRNSQEDWSTIAERLNGLARSYKPKAGFDFLNLTLKPMGLTRVEDGSDTPFSNRRSLVELNPQQIPEWPLEVGHLEKVFSRLRDFRFLKSKEQPELLRRLTWLYPDDGCQSRATGMQSLLSEWGYPKPAKFFVFGNLRLKTNYARTGDVTWWYHVAIAYSFQSNVVIFDPAVESSRYLLLKEWIDRITDDDESRGEVLASVCDGTTPGPYGPCHQASQSGLKVTQENQANFLELEWVRMIYLGLSPRKLLGDEPPWQIPSQVPQTQVPQKQTPLAQIQ